MSSLGNVVWAYEQRCPSPLAKLLLIRIADGVGHSLRFTYRLDMLAEYATATPAEVLDALLSLEANGQLLIIEEFDEAVDLALPWYRKQDMEVRAVRQRTLQHRAHIRKYLIEQQQGRCWYCSMRFDDPNEPTPHVEHQTPLCRGGADEMANLVMACSYCNQEKGRKTLEEYRAEIITRHKFDRSYRFPGEEQ